MKRLTVRYFRIQEDIQREMLPETYLGRRYRYLFYTVNLAGNLFIYNLRNHVYEDAYSSLQHWCTGGESGAL